MEKKRCALYTSIRKDNMYRSLKINVMVPKYNDQKKTSDNTFWNRLGYEIDQHFEHECDYFIGYAFSFDHDFGSGDKITKIYPKKISKTLHWVGYEKRILAKLMTSFSLLVEVQKSKSSYDTDYDVYVEKLHQCQDIIMELINKLEKEAHWNKFQIDKDDFFKAILKNGLS